MKRNVALGFTGAGVASYYFPGFGGIFFENANVTAGEGRITSAILLVGAAILWFMPER